MQTGMKEPRKRLLLGLGAGDGEDYNDYGGYRIVKVPLNLMKVVITATDARGAILTRPFIAPSRPVGLGRRPN